MNRTIEKATAELGQLVLLRRIGSTTYRVGIHYNPDAKETLDDKILRLLKNDLNLGSSHATMGLSQAGRLRGGNSL